MRVGVVLGDFVPEDGGGFTFVSAIVRALVAADIDSTGLELTLFCGPDAFRYVTVECGAHCRVCCVSRERALHRVVKRLQQWMPLFKRFYPRKSLLEKTLDGQQIQFAWFVAGSGEVLDIPYAATVWDIQHRTHPWFPEVSAGSTWDGREIVFSTYVRRASIIVTGTLVGKKELVRYYQVNESQVVILPHPTPTFALDAAHEQGKSVLPSPLTSSTPFFFYPAQYWAHKNHATLIEAFSLYLNRINKDVKMVFVGSDKGNKAYLQELVERHQLQDSILFLGFLERTELVALYQHAIAMVYPSFSGPENLPPLEAFALGCPVLYAEFPGAREQLGEAAEYFDPFLPASIAGALERISTDKGLRLRLVALGRVRANQWVVSDFVNGVFAALRSFKGMRSCWR